MSLEFTNKQVEQNRVEKQTHTDVGTEYNNKGGISNQKVDSSMKGVGTTGK